MLVYKILTADQRGALQREGAFEGAPVDLEDGYIHLSAGYQVAGTAEKHFSSRQGLWLVALDAARLGSDLKWEKARGGADFPHLYRPITLADIVWVRPMQQEPDGSFHFAEETGP